MKKAAGDKSVDVFVLRSNVEIHLVWLSMHINRQRFLGGFLSALQTLGPELKNARALVLTGFNLINFILLALH